jgi:hypothetical protein
MQLGRHPVAVIRYSFTNKEYIEQHNREKQYIEQHNREKQYIEQHKIWEECGPCPVFASYTLAFTLQLRKKPGRNLSQGRRIMPVGTMEREYTEQWFLLMKGLERSETCRGYK